MICSFSSATKVWNFAVLLAYCLTESLIGRRSSDLQSITALTGHKGIELAGSRQPDVVLMDTDLPDLPGLNFLKILRDNPLTSYIPVIALSSSAHPQQVDAGLRAGC